MNTDNKYRAWDKQDKIMWQPLTLEELIKGDWELSTEDQEYTLPHSDYLEFAHEYTVWMESTGLQDKNKKDIYVGDILSERWKVEVYQNKEGAFMVRFHNTPAVNKPRSLFKYLQSREKAGTSDKDCVVIGDTFSNPELLKQ